MPTPAVCVPAATSQGAGIPATVIPKGPLDSI